MLVEGANAPDGHSCRLPLVTARASSAFITWLEQSLFWERGFIPNFPSELPLVCLEGLQTAELAISQNHTSFV